MMSRFLFITAWLPLEETEQRPRSCQVSLRRHRTGTTSTYDRDSRRRVRRCLSESFPQVGSFQCYYSWPTHHYECTVSGTHLSHCSLADLYMYCRTHLYGIIACIEWILWSLELIMHWFYTCCINELWMYWTWFSVSMKFQYIRSDLSVVCGCLLRCIGLLVPTEG